MSFNKKILDIWYIPFDIKYNIDYLLSILDLNEKLMSEKFFKKTDRDRYIISHAYLRILLSKYYPLIQKDEWKFKVNKYGKPEISNECSYYIYFNISHTETCAYLIFSTYPSCGIDVETYKKINLKKEMLNLIFTNEEKKEFTLYENKIEFFYILWTLKEAYLKAKGVGFFENMSNVDFSYYFSKNLNNFFVNNNTEYYWVYKNKDHILSIAILNEIEIKNLEVYNIKEAL